MISSSSEADGFGDFDLEEQDEEEVELFFKQLKVPENNKHFKIMSVSKVQGGPERSRQSNFAVFTEEDEFDAKYSYSK